MPRGDRAGGTLTVALFAPAWPVGAAPNGIVTYTDALAPALERQGLATQVLAASVGGAVDESRVSDLDHIFARRPVWARLLSRLLYRTSPTLFQRHYLRWSLIEEINRLVRERGLHLVEMEESFGMAAHVVRRCDVAVVVRLHGPWFLNGVALGVPRNEAFDLRIDEEGRALRIADAVYAPSRDVLNRTIAHYGFSLGFGEVIPYPMSVVPEDQRWRSDTCEPGRILFVGRFDAHKGGDIMIDAFRQLHALRPEARLTFVGPDRGVSGPGGRQMGLRQYIDATIPEPTTRAAIEWLGPLPPTEISTQRRRACVAAVASRYETVGYVALEAMAMGCPLVVPDAGGLSEVVQHERNGLLFRSEDAAGLAAALARVLGNPAFATSLGARAFADCSERYDPDRIAARTVDLYRAVLARRALGPRRTEPTS